MQRMEGASLIDFLIIIATATVLLAVAVPSAGTIRDSRNVDRIISLAEDLGRGANRYYHDTGSFALEYAASEDGSSYLHPRFHQLSMPQSLSGWQGPYLSAPLRQSDSPVSGAIYLVNDLSVAPAAGFVLGEEGKKVTGAGQYLILHGISERLARSCNERIDGDEEGGWDRRGRCEWVPEGGGSMSIFLLQAAEAKGEVR